MRRWQFSLRSVLLLTAITAVLLVPVSRIIQVWRSSTSATVTVRVTSSGTVKFGNKEVLAEECLSLLANSAQDLRSHGLRPDLLVEAYSNAKQSDLESVAELGERAGFESVKTKYLAWPDHGSQPASF